MSNPERPPVEPFYISLFRRYPVATAVIAVVVFLVWTFPIGFAQAWPAFVKDKTIPEWLEERRWPGMTAQLYGWLTIVFFLTLVILLVAIIIVSRRRGTPAQTAPAAEQIPAADVEQQSRIKQQEAEIARLQEAGKEAIREIEKFRNEAESNRLKADFNQQLLDNLKWEHEFVEYQLKALRKYVVVEGCEINSSHLLAGKQYVEFTFHVRNYSMFYVSIPMSKYEVVKGAIKFKGDPVSGEAKLVENKVIGLQPYGRRYFKIWQWVNSKEAEEIPATLETVGNRFDFSETIIHVIADKFPRIAAALDLTRGMQNADLENKIIELGNANAELIREIHTWRERISYVEELNRALGACYDAYSQMDRREFITRDALNNLKHRIAHALSHRPNEPKMLSDFYDELPPIPDAAGEQKEWVDSQCINLRALIEEEHQKLSVDDQNEGSTPNS